MTLLPHPLWLRLFEPLLSVIEALLDTSVMIAWPLGLRAQQLFHPRQTGSDIITCHPHRVESPHGCVYPVSIDWAAVVPAVSPTSTSLPVAGSGQHRGTHHGESYR